MTVPRRRKAFLDGVLAALSGPSDLMSAAYERPLRYRKFSVEDAWREVGVYLGQETAAFEARISRESGDVGRKT
jgi:hypothetical protein